MAGLNGSLSAALRESAARHAQREALAFHNEDGTRQRFGYGEVMSLALRLAQLLAQRGVEPGDRVATLSGNRPEVLLAYLACWLSGVVACPVNVGEAPERWLGLLRRSRARLALAEGPHLAALALAQGEEVPDVRVEPLDGLLARLWEYPEAEPSAFPPDTPAFLVYTSGTTGAAKGVPLSHGNLLANARATASWHGLGPGDAVLSVLPIHHVNGAIVTGLSSFLAGAKNVLLPRFSSATFWRSLADEGAALASLVPTLLEFLLAADEDISRHDLSRLRYVLCGAGPLLPETVLRFEERFGVAVCHGFGMSEATAYNTQFPMDLPGAQRTRWYQDFGFPSVGCALSCNEVAVLREDGGEAERLERGQLAVRGPSVMAGYEDDPKANARAFRGDWFLSGDQGFYERDQAGRKHFFLSGRLKELIIRGGLNLSPLEIDEVLRRCPGVRFALAVPFANRVYGEEVAAYIVPDAGASLTEEAVLGFAARHLGFAARPKVVVFGTDVPFTATGKPKRVALAEQLREQLEPYRDVQFRQE